MIFTYEFSGSIETDECFTNEGFKELLLELIGDNASLDIEDVRRYCKADKKISLEVKAKGG